MFPVWAVRNSNALSVSYIYGNHFLSGYVLAFLLSNMSFDEEVINFNDVCDFFFMITALCTLLKKSCLPQGHEDFFLCFLLEFLLLLLYISCLGL